MTCLCKRDAVLRVTCALAMVSVTLPLLSHAVGASAHTVPTSIDRTGRQDVTAQLNDFIARVPDGASVSFPPNATFRVEGVLAVEGRRDLVLDFNGARVIANTDGSGIAPHHRMRRDWPRHRPHLAIFDSSGIEVRDLVVRGPHADGGTDEGAWRIEYEAQHAIEVTRSKDVSIQGCNVSEVFGDGIYIGNESERVGVRDCEIHHNGRQGVSITAARAVTIEGNHLHDIRRSAFDLEPHPDARIENILIQDNQVGPTRLNFVSGHGSGSTFTGVRILDNSLDTEMEISLRAPDGTRRGSVEIRGNQSTRTFGSPAALIRTSGYDDVVIAENTSAFDGRSGGVAVKVLEGCRVDVSDNAFTNVERQHQIEFLPICLESPTRGGTAPEPERQRTRPHRSSASAPATSPSSTDRDQSRGPRGVTVTPRDVSCRILR